MGNLPSIHATAYISKSSQLASVLYTMSHKHLTRAKEVFTHFLAEACRWWGQHLASKVRFFECIEPFVNSWRWCWWGGVVVWEWFSGGHNSGFFVSQPVWAEIMPKLILFYVTLDR